MLPQIASVDVHQLFLYMSVAEMLAAIPAGMVLKRIGLSPWWALLCFVPMVAVAALWLLAFIRWPRDVTAA